MHFAGFVAIGNHIGEQALVAAFVFTRQHHYLLYCCVARQHRFDFAQLNAEAADLYLVVAAS